MIYEALILNVLHNNNIMVVFSSGERDPFKYIKKCSFLLRFTVEI